MQHRPKIEFPKIRHIDEIMPHIQGRSDIIVIDKGDYKVIDYVYADSDTFDNIHRRECRGLKFSRNGDLIARPFHKFFNLEEKAESSSANLDFDEPHVILDKLDGSMVHSALLGDRLVLMTRKGITEHAERAYELLNEHQKHVLKNLCQQGITVILEYTGPENQIILYYDKPALTFLGARENLTGKYLNWIDPPFPKPRSFKGPLNLELIKEMRNHKEIEGYVVVFEDGHRIKLKTEEYLEKHRTLGNATLEIHYLDTYLAGVIDDVISIKHGEFKERLIRWRDQLNKHIDTQSKIVQQVVDDGKDLDQKTFATQHLANYADWFRAVCFDVRKGNDARESILKYLKKRINSQRDLEEKRIALGGIKLHV